MNYGVYVFFAASICLSFAFCFKKINKYRKEPMPTPEFGVEATKMAEAFGVVEKKKHRKKAKQPTRVSKHRNVK